MTAATVATPAGGENIAGAAVTSIGEVVRNDVLATRLGGGDTETRVTILVNDGLLRMCRML